MCTSMYKSLGGCVEDMPIEGGDISAAVQCQARYASYMTARDRDLR